MILFVALITFPILLIVVYLSRIFLAGNSVHSGDTFFHLLVSRHIRKNRGEYPTALQGIIFDEADKKYSYLTYPPFFHYVISIFPIKLQLSAAKFLNLLILCSLGTLTAILSYYLTLSISLALFSGVITIFNMAVFELEVTLTPRPLGLLFYSLAVCVAIFYPTALLSIIAIPLLVALTILTHKFATQALLFSLIPYAIVFNQLGLILEFAAGILLALIFSRGQSFKILKEHVGWLRFYFHFPSRVSYPRKLVSILMRNFWYVAIFTSIALLLYQNSLNLSTQFTTQIFYWVLAPFVVALLVAIPYISFLGEDYRYLEYSVLPIGIASALLMQKLDILILFSFLACLGASIIVLYKYKKRLSEKNSLLKTNDILSYQSLGKYNLGNFLVFPHTRTLEVNYFTGLKVVHPVRSKEFKKPSENLEDLLSKYQIRYMLRFKGEAVSFKHFEDLKNVVDVKAISDFPSFELYEINDYLSESFSAKAQGKIVEDASAVLDGPKAIVTVAICVRNMEKYISDCIKSVLNQSFSTFELIIIDDASTDQTQKLIEQFKDKRIRYIRNKNVLGLSASRNQCIEYSKCDFVFFTDADCVVSRTWIEEGLQSIKDFPNSVGVEGRTYYVSENYKPTRSDAIMENIIGGEYLTCNIVFKKNVVRDVGEFDPKFLYHEDRDLALRIRKIGKIVFNPKMIVYHQKKQISPMQFVKSGYRLRNRVLLYKKYGDKPEGLFLGRIVYPKDLIKIIFPPILFGSFLANKYENTEDWRIFPFIYVKLVYERLGLWHMCAQERIFLI